MTEKWRWIFGYEGRYEVSNLGNIRSYYKNGKIKLMRSVRNYSGYRRVMLYKKGKAKLLRIHRLVADAFVANPDTTTKRFINHIDGIKENNAASNLEWCTPSENMRHASAQGLLTYKIDLDVEYIKHLYLIENLTQKQIAAMLGVCTGTINNRLRLEGISKRTGAISK